MSRFDRYVFAQLLSISALFALVLVGILWVNRAVLMFNRMAGEGHALRLILEMTALALPGLILMALPVSAFAAAVQVTNRLIRESELVVMQAVGFSALRLARPVLVFGASVALAMALLVHLAAPAARAALSAREAAVARDVTSGLLREGVFQFPAPGVTLFVHKVGAEGRLTDVLLVDTRAGPQGEHKTYTAASGQLFSGLEAPGLVLRDGMIQTLAPQTRRLGVTRFGELALPLDLLVGGGGVAAVPMAAVPTARLLLGDPELQAATRRSQAALRAEAQMRLSQPLMGLATALLGFAAMLQGAFSRLGLWRQILGAAVLMILMQIVATWAQAQVVRNGAPWPLFWLAPGLGLGAALLLLLQAQRPRRPSRPPAPQGVVA